MPQKHSKNNTDGAVFTHHERRLAGYGTQKQRLGTDSQNPFGYCCLSLKPVVDPVVRCVCGGPAGWFGRSIDARAGLVWSKGPGNPHTTHQSRLTNLTPCTLTQPFGPPLLAGIDRGVFADQDPGAQAAEGAMGGG